MKTKRLLSIKLTDAKHPGLIIGFGESENEPQMVSITVYPGQPIPEVAKTLRLLADALVAGS